ncbi:kinase-like domain-containing protein, partial [Russula emetica]
MDWHTLQPKKFANYFHDVAVGLKSLHDHGVIHGNIRPQTILQNEGRCYLANFVISKFDDEPSSFSFAPALVKSQHLPELPDGSVTRRDKNTDIFLVGCTMYQVLTREIPDIATGCPERPKRRLGQEWDAIWNVVERCMSEYPTDRPTAVELVESLKAM